MDFLSLLRLIRVLYQDKSSVTFKRLISSRHVADLRFIVYVTIVGVALIVVFALIAVVLGKLEGWQATAFFVPFIGTTLAVGGTIVAWTYQTGIARLGIVDLFACEIVTVCRVCSIVDLTRKCIAAFEFDMDPNHQPDSELVDRMRESFSHYDSSESYTPAFDSNAKDLHSLDVRVVPNIAAFYTFLGLRLEGASDRRHHETVKNITEKLD